MKYLHLVDGIGQRVREPMENCAVGLYGTEILARIKSDPFIILQCVGVETDGRKEKVDLEVFSSHGLTVFSGRDKISVYEVIDCQLKFLRNLKLPIQLFPWVQKRPGTYVCFTEENVGAVVITKQGHEFVSPISAGLPISHLAPSQAWY